MNSCKHSLSIKNLSRVYKNLTFFFYRDFVHICGAALELNGKLILLDQREYQEVLSSSFHDLVSSLSVILEDPSFNSEWRGSVSSSMANKRSSVLVFNAISSGSGSSTA